MADNPQRTRGKRIRSVASSRGEAQRLRDINSRIRGVAVHHAGRSNFAATAMDRAIYYDCEANAETVETHCVPRKSLEEKLMLRAFPQKVEVEAIPTRQIGNNGEWVHTEEHRVTWKSDRRLLLQAPKDDITQVPFRREGSISVGQHTRKFTKADREKEVPTETIIENFVDDEEGI